MKTIDIKAMETKLNEAKEYNSKVVANKEQDKKIKATEKQLEQIKTAYERNMRELEEQSKKLEKELEVVNDSDKPTDNSMAKVWAVGGIITANVLILTTAFA